MITWLMDRRILSAAKTRVRKQFAARVVGTTFANRDHTSRQKIIRELLRPGMALDLSLETGDPGGGSAVGLLAPGGGQIGHLDTRLSSDVRKWLDQGLQVLVTVKEVTGALSGRLTCGVDVLIRVFEPAADRTAPPR